MVTKEFAKDNIPLSKELEMPDWGPSLPLKM